MKHLDMVMEPAGKLRHHAKYSRELKTFVDGKTKYVPKSEYFW